MRLPITLLLATIIITSLAIAQPASPPTTPDTGGLPLPEEVAMSVTLTQPDDNAELIPGTVTFTADVSNKTPLQECTLFIDGNDIKTTAEKPVTFEQSFPSSQEGEYEWMIACEDESSQAQSETRTLEIKSPPGPKILLDDAYVITQTMDIIGEDFAPLENIEVTIEYDNETIESTITSTNSEGTFETNHTIPQDAPTGTYTIAAYDINSGDGTSAETTITLPPAILIASPREVEVPGETTIIGEDFLKESDITLAIEGEEETIETDDQGSFETTITIDEAKNYTITATQDEREDLQANTTVTGTLAPDTTAPEITLNNPNGGFTREEGSVTFEYTPQDARGVDRCELYIDSSLEETSDDVTEGTLNDFTTTLSPGAYEWYVRCEDPAMNVGSSSTRTITIEEPQEPTTETPGTGLGGGSQGSQEPSTQQPSTTPEPEEGGFGLITWMLIILLLAGLLIGGLVGYTAYEGELDTSSTTALIGSVKKALGLETKEPLESQDTSFTPADEQVVKSYLEKKRDEGYDDLTIHNALKKQGWREAELDAIFDKIYKAQP